MSQCFKCKQAIGTIVSRDGPTKLYCSNCFLTYCAGAVRENAFQECLVPSDTPLAVAVSGGPNSMMLLHEFGQLRYKAHDQIRRKQLAQQRQACAQGAQSCGIYASSSSATSTSLVSSLVLLPFHLCEDELVLPPLPLPQSSSPPSSSSLHECSGRHEAIEEVRSTMKEQFTKLRKYVQHQPPRWVYHTEVLSEYKSAKKKQNTLTAAMETDGARAGGACVATPGLSVSSGGSSASPASSQQQRHVEASGETAATDARLFDETEMRLFHYSDFLSERYVSEVRHALHASKLSLSDREALYARVRQQTLCRAAQRVCREHRQREAAAAAAAGAGGMKHEESIRRGETCCSEAQERFDEHVSLHDTSWGGKSHLLLGNNAARCAIAALEALVTGASGEGVVHGAGFRGFTHEVVCLRPIRTMLPKETILYTRLHGIVCSYTPALCTCTATRSIHRTLEQFVLTMMASYRTMIFNVLNTVQRLGVHPAAVQELVSGEGSAAAGNSQLAGKTSRKALPGRTAQQNRDDGRLTAPLHVHRDPRRLSLKEADRYNAIAMCCVCGCPASLAACHRGHRTDTAERQLALFALCPISEATPRASEVSSLTIAGAASSETSVMPSCFVCYACRGLADSWSPSVFGSSSTTGNGESGDASSTATGVASRHDVITSTASVSQLCKLFF
nr:unnamed protein product [Leishmania braziliensis]